MLYYYLVFPSSIWILNNNWKISNRNELNEENSKPQPLIRDCKINDIFLQIEINLTFNKFNSLTCNKIMIIICSPQLNVLDRLLFFCLLTFPPLICKFLDFHIFAMQSVSSPIRCVHVLSNHLWFTNNDWRQFPWQ